MQKSLRNVLLAAATLAILAALLGAYALNRAHLDPPDVAIIAHGEKVDIGAHAVAGKYTVFDFYAVWCPPCRALSPALEKLASRNARRLAIRKVDIVDWTMPVAEQYGIQELPWLVVYDETGRKLAEGDAAFDELDRLFGKGALDVPQHVTEKPTAM